MSARSTAARLRAPLSVHPQRAERPVTDLAAKRVRDERRRVLLVAGTNCDEVAAGGADVVVSLAQLRGMFAAVQSTEMSEEHQHDRSVAPQITQAVWFSGAVDQRRLGERGEIHAGEPIYSSPRALIGHPVPLEASTSH